MILIRFSRLAGLMTYGNALKGQNISAWGNALRYCEELRAGFPMTGRINQKNHSSDNNKIQKR